MKLERKQQKRQELAREYARLCQEDYDALCEKALKERESAAPNAQALQEDTESIEEVIIRQLHSKAVTKRQEETEEQKQERFHELMQNGIQKEDF